MYNQSNVVIVPSEQMQDKLLAEGLTGQDLIQRMWDHPMICHCCQPPVCATKPCFTQEVWSVFRILSNWSYAMPLEIFFA